MSARATKLTISPSQWVNFGWFLFMIPFLAAGIGLYIPFLTGIGIFIGLIWIWRMIVISCWKFTFDENTETIIEQRGVFNITTVEIQYFRVKSVRVQKPFLLRLFDLSTVEIITSEPFKPMLIVYAIYDGDKCSKFVLDMAKYWRDEKGVKEADFHHF